MTSESSETDQSNTDLTPTFDQVTSFFVEKNVSYKCPSCGGGSARIHADGESLDSPVSIVGTIKILPRQAEGKVIMKAENQYLASIAVECGNCAHLQFFSYGPIVKWVNEQRKAQISDEN